MAHGETQLGLSPISVSVSLDPSYQVAGGTGFAIFLFSLHPGNLIGIRVLGLITNL